MSDHHRMMWAAAMLSIWGIWRSVTPVEPLPLIVFSVLLVGSVALSVIGVSTQPDT